MRARPGAARRRARRPTRGSSSSRRRAGAFSGNIFAAGNRADTTGLRVGRSSLSAVLALHRVRCLCMETVSFTRMADGTREDYELLARYEAEYTAKLPDRLLAALDALKHSLVGYKVSALRALAPVGDPRAPRRQERGVRRRRAPARHRRRARAAHPQRDGRGDPAAVRLGGDLLDRRPPRRLPDVLLRRALRRRPERARAVPRQPVLRRVRRVLRALRPELLRPGVRVAARSSSSSRW